MRSLEKESDSDNEDDDSDDGSESDDFVDVQFQRSLEALNNSTPKRQQNAIENQEIIEVLLPQKIQKMKEKS